MIVMAVVTIVVIMTMFVVVVMPMVFATIGCGRQLTVEIRSDQLFQGRVCHSGPHRDAMMGEVGQRALTDAARNDNLDALLTQPARKCAGLMFRRGQHVGMQRYLLFRVHLHQRKLTAAAEVSVQVAVFMGDGNFHTRIGF